VTMKMISNTSMTSISGVTLISASGPVLPAALNAMVRSLQRGRLPQVHSTPADGRVVCRSSGGCAVGWMRYRAALSDGTDRQASFPSSCAGPYAAAVAAVGSATIKSSNIRQCLRLACAGAGLALAKMGAVACPWRVGPGRERMRMKGGALLGLVLLGS